MRGSVLEPVAEPCLGLLALCAHLSVLLAGSEVRTRKRRTCDEESYQATLVAFVAAVATIALSQIPPKNGVYVAFGEGRYIGSVISPTALRTIRDGLAQLGLILPGKWFYNREKPGKSYCTRIRHTEDFTTLAHRFGLRLNLLVQPPEDVIAMSRGELGTIPDDVKPSEAVVRRYNRFIRQFDLRVPQEAWSDQFWIVSKGGTNGKGDRLLRGYNDARIYLTRTFAETYERGGRLYGPYYQNMSKAIRARLLIDGEATKELDFSRIHPTILFAEKGLAIDRDPYDVPGFPDMIDAGKVTFNRLLNSRTRLVPYRPKEDGHLFQSADHFKRYKQAMIEHLSPISDTIFQDAGARLQRRDSELALRILMQCMDRSIPVYPVHDSFIVPSSYEDEVRTIMMVEFEHMFGFVCQVK